MRRKKMNVLTKLILGAVLVYAAMSLVVLQAKINDQKQQQVILAEQLSQEKMRNASLSQATDYELSDEEIAQLMREKRGLILPGDKALVDISK